VDYFQKEARMDESALVTADCVAVKGDYFYLKKGEEVLIKNSIKGYF
jgi:hypothetical protein